MKKRIAKPKDPPPSINETLYEIHGYCHADSIDISKWVIGKDEVECRVGFYYDLFLIDWVILKMKYNNPVKLPSKSEPLWTCKDSYGTVKTIATPK